MIYHSILFSFCLIGMTSAKITYCKNAEGKIEVSCKSTEDKPCIFKTNNNKVVASTDGITSPDKLYKDKVKANLEGGVCKLLLTDNTLTLTNVSCSLGSHSENTIITSKEAEPCSAANVLQYAGVSLLLTLLFTSLLS